MIVLRVCLAALLCVLASCVSSKGPAFKNLFPVPQLSAADVTVQLSDSRPSVDAKAPGPGVFTFPGQGEELSPELDPALGMIIQQTLAEALAPGSLSLRVHVNVLEARAGWRGNFMSETEHAKAEVEVSVWDAIREVEVASGIGASWGERSSPDTSKVAVMKLLNRVIGDAVNRALHSPGISAALQVP